jgi:PST family polysaccharide transporter
LGLYDRAYRIVTNPVSQLTTPFGRVALPLLQRLRSDDAKYRSTYLSMVRMAVALGTPAILTVLVFAKPIFLVLLGPRWSAIAPIVTWMCVGALGSTTFASTFWLFASQGRTAEQLRYVTVTSIVSVLGFLAGLPWGAVGVAAGGALSFLFVSTPVICWGATREGAVRPRALLIALGPLALVTLATAGALGAFSVLQQAAGRWWLLLAPIVAYACFTALLFTFPAGRRMLANVRGMLWLSRG